MTEATQPHALTRKEARDRIQSVLVAAQQARTALREYSLIHEANGDLSPMFVIYERSVMLDTVWALCKIAGRPKPTYDDILQVERRAMGHSDYTQQLVYGCLDIIFPTTDRR